MTKSESTLTQQQELDVKDVMLLGFKPRRITVAKLGRASVIEATKGNPSTSELRDMMVGKSRIFFVMRRGKEPLAVTSETDALTAARLSPENHWSKISGKTLSVAGQRIHSQRKKNSMESTTWRARLENAIIETMSVGYEPFLWHSCFSSGVPDNDPIIIEARLGAKIGYFCFMAGRQGRPYETLDKAKEKTNITYLMTNTVPRTYVIGLRDAAEVVKKKNVDNAKVRAETEKAWDQIKKEENAAHEAALSATDATKSPALTPDDYDDSIWNSYCG